MSELRDHPDRQFQLAVMNFQRFAGLNVTGMLTASQMNIHWLDQFETFTSSI